jgi:hypothetical protein
VNRAIGALAAYGDALRTVAEADYSGRDLGSLATDAGSLAEAVPSAPASVASLAKALGGDSGPVARLAQALKQGYAKHEVARIVAQAHEPVTGILGALRRYLIAVGREEAEWEKETQKALGTVDAVLAERYAGGRVSREENALQALELADIAQRWTNELDSTRRQSAALFDAVEKLGAAEEVLRRADGDDRSPEIPALLGLVAEVLGDVAAVRNAVRCGGRS